MKSLTLFPLFALLLLSGCLKEEFAITVNSDYSGTVKIARKASGRYAKMLLKSYSEAQDQSAETHKKKLAESLAAKYRGVNAWSDLSVELKGEDIHILATGYCEDLRKFEEIQIDRRTGKQTPSRQFTVIKSESGTTTIAFKFINYTGDNPRLAKMTDAEKKQYLENQVKTLGQYLKGMELRTRLNLPTTPTNAKQMKISENSAVGVVDYERIRKMMLEQEKIVTMSVDVTMPEAKRPEEFSKQFAKAKEDWAKLEASFK